MITKDDFILLIQYLKDNKKIDIAIDIENKWNEFIEKRENSDYINSHNSEDATYDAEMELINKILSI